MAMRGVGSFFTGLSRRERTLLLVGGVVLLGFALWGFINLTQWYLDRMQTLERLTRQKQDDRITLVRLRQDYLGLKDQIREVEDQIERDRGTFSLLSFLETLAGNQGVRSNIAYMRPQPSTEVDGYQEVGVEIKMQNVTEEQTVRLLSSIEDAPHWVRVKRLRMRTRFADPQFMDVTFLTTTYEEK